MNIETLYTAAMESINEIIEHVDVSLRKLDVAKSMRTIAKTARETGLSRTSVYLLRDGSLGKLLKDECPRINRPTAFDYNPKFNKDFSIEIAETLERLANSALDEKELSRDVSVRLEAFNNIRRELNNAISTIAKRGIRELSNASKEAIPVRVRDYAMARPVMFRVLEEGDAPTAGIESLTRKDILDQLSGILEIGSKVPFCSEKRSELVSIVKDCKRKLRTQTREALQTLSLYELYRKCS